VSAKILLVDDEPQLLRVLRPALAASGYEVIAASCGAEALTAFRVGGPDLVVLDLGLPDMDGKETLRRLRILSDVPVIVLSARDRESEKVAALDLGADDYVEKPFGMDELLARIRAALRPRAAAAVDRIVAEDLVVDLGMRSVTKAGVPVKLTPKEYDLLVFLGRHPGRAVAHAEILSALWGRSHRADTQYLRVLVGHLRAKIENDPADPRIVLTEQSIGYRLVGPPE